MRQQLRLKTITGVIYEPCLVTGIFENGARRYAGGDRRTIQHHAAGVVKICPSPTVVSGSGSILGYCESRNRIDRLSRSRISSRQTIRISKIGRRILAGVMRAILFSQSRGISLSRKSSSVGMIIVSSWQTNSSPAPSLWRRIVKRNTPDDTVATFFGAGGKVGCQNGELALAGTTSVVCCHSSCPMPQKLAQQGVGFQATPVMPA